MKKFAIVFVVSLFFGSLAYGEVAVITPETPDAAAPAVTGAKKYICLMDGFESDMPGKCEKCGMELLEAEVPVETAAATEATPVVTE